ncbi:hypothetical protein Nmel_011622, partial [Mimus melanotis]
MQPGKTSDERALAGTERELFNMGMRGCIRAVTGEEFWTHLSPSKHQLYFGAAKGRNTPIIVDIALAGCVCMSLGKSQVLPPFGRLKTNFYKASSMASAGALGAHSRTASTSSAPSTSLAGRGQAAASVRCLHRGEQGPCTVFHRSNFVPPGHCQLGRGQCRAREIGCRHQSIQLQLLDQR